MQRGQPMGVEGMDGSAHALGGAPEIPGDRGRALLPGTDQENLTAPQPEGVGGTKAGREWPAFLRCQGSYLHGWFHTA